MLNPRMDGWMDGWMDGTNYHVGVARLGTEMPPYVARGPKAKKRGKLPKAKHGDPLGDPLVFLARLRNQACGA